MPAMQDSSTAVQDYLEQIHNLIESKGYARAVEIAGNLGVSQASVSAMLRRLDAEGFVVHERYRGLVGRNVVLPLVGRLIPVVADEYSDPEKGTGAVKITPAHDFNDFEVGRRHDLEAINIFDKFARVNDNAPEKYRGLDRFEARKRVVADLEALIRQHPSGHL